MNRFSSILSRGVASGRWAGHYEQHGRSFPIEATLKHRGDRLFGTMIDVIGRHDQSLRSLLEESNVPSGEIEQFIDEVRSHFPGSPKGEIEYRSNLPEKSLIEGRVEQYRMSFTKRYEGYHEIEYDLNGLVLPDSVPCEIVRYIGTMTPEFASVSGDWSITPVDESKTKVSGTFQLNRQPAG